MTHPDDPIRQEILRYAYDVHRREVASENGQVAGDRFVAGVRQRTGIEQKLLVAALDYLVGTGHVNHILVPIVRHGSTVPGMNKHYYRISAKGIEAMEPPSAFKGNSSSSTVTVVNQSGVAIVGDNNTVSVGANDLPLILAELKRLVVESKSISTSQAREVVGDIESIEAQVKKAKPNKEIIATAWKGIEAVVTGAEFTAIASRTAEFLSRLL